MCHGETRAGKAGFGIRQSNISSGVIACTGNSYCKYAQSNTKGHALAVIKHLEKRLELDQPVNIHLTGCPNSCASITWVTSAASGRRCMGGWLSRFCRGGFGKNQAVGRQVFSGVSATELPATLETMLRVYLKRREGRETFQQFTTRHDLNALQVMFTNAE